MPYAKPPTVTVDALIALYLRHCQSNGIHCPEARYDRVKTLNLFVAQYGRLNVELLKPYHLTDFVNAHPGWKSTSTKRAKSNMIRACFGWACDEERIDRNPFKKIRYPEAERRPDMPDEIIDRMCRVSNKRFEAVIRFLRLTGARLSEMANAQWADFDLIHGIWTIPRHKSRRYTQKPKIVALVPAAVSLLKGIERFADVVFLNNKNRPWNRRTLWRALKRTKDRFGIDCKASLHGIRHRTASAALDNGASLELVSEQLGHSNTVVTKRFYWNKSESTLNGMRAAIQAGIEPR